ncbi:MAG: radical SAM protein [Sorangiineae bacterium]|nr:radical SAM protein [Polyangiaceae bacterium]MEB2321830.1 radical SAM protein [Sorangiineae bacterium]
MGKPLPRLEPARARAPSHVLVETQCNLGCASCAKCAARGAVELGAWPPGPVVITGGEPMLARGLLTRIRASSELTWLETNGTLLSSEVNVARLARAGLHGVRLFLPGWDRTSTDRIARVEGAGALQERAAENLLAAGLALAFVVPVWRAYALQLHEWLGRAERLAERRRHRDTPLEVSLAWMLAPDEPLDETVELALGRFALEATRRSMVARFDGPLAPAACAFTRPEAFASLFADAAPQRKKKPPTCAGCALDESCPGPGAGRPARALSPDGRAPIAFELAVDTLRRAGDVHAWVHAGESRRWGRENFVSIGSEPEIGAARAVPSALLRAFYNCNEDCTFCWVDLKQPRVPDAAVNQTLALMGLEKLRALSITGGEPTLDRRLEAQIRLARALGVTQVTLQTNAVMLADAEHARRLAHAGLTRAFVSLHGSTRATSERITRTPDTFERTIDGIQNLLAAGVSVGVGVVFTHENREEARALVELVATRLAGADLTLSVAAPINDRLEVEAITPRYGELAPTLREAAYAAHELGVPFAGLFGQCGVPPCVLDADPVCFPELAREHPDWSAAEDFLHAEACSGCRLEKKCPGIRRSYAAVYGTSELRRLR